MADAVCDFCNAPNPIWAYEASPMNVATFSNGINTKTARWDGGWDACDACSNLIEKRDLDGLLDRVTQSFAGQHAPSDPLFSVAMGVMLRGAYQQLLSTIGARKTWQPHPIQGIIEWDYSLEEARRARGVTGGKN